MWLGWKHQHPASFWEKDKKAIKIQKVSLIRRIRPGKNIENMITTVEGVFIDVPVLNPI